MSQIETHLAQIESALRKWYSKEANVKKYLAIAKETLLRGEEYRHTAAQYGGKYGNFTHVIALTKKGKYAFFAGWPNEIARCKKDFASKLILVHQGDGLPMKLSLVPNV